ncbi:MAG: hypothetical protein MUF84_15085 [Anaerolineae bacterium]|jgi:hypothetical protein|nr:hypothetical protein [Anaerolineae bacterium]
MKAKVLLIVALSILVSLVALPVLADNGDTAMWVSRVRLSYIGRSSSSPDRVMGMVYVRDANRKPVVGAAVTVSWSLPNGQFEETVVTSTGGIARSYVWEGDGTYQLEVLDVVKLGWLYVAEQSLLTSASLTIPWSRR